MDTLPLTALGVGFLLGIRHAFDPDHLLAVTTIVSEHRSLFRSSLIGTFWGLGHTISLLIVGVPVLTFKLQMPQQLVVWMEFGVGAMLVGLGLMSIQHALGRWRLHVHFHTHDGRPHCHFHFHQLESIEQHHHRHLFRIGTRPFLVGLVHGLAGSGGLILVVLASIRSEWAGVFYIALFGLGSIGAMLLLSSLVTLPLIMRASSRWQRGSQLLAGLGSVTFGLLFAASVAF